jgi:predicted ATPase
MIQTLAIANYRSVRQLVVPGRLNVITGASGSRRCDAPARQPQLGRRTPVLSHNGRDLAAALP